MIDNLVIYEVDVFHRFGATVPRITTNRRYPLRRIVLETTLLGSLAVKNAPQPDSVKDNSED